MANITFPRQFLYIAAATIGAKLGWEFASEYNMLVKIISALVGFYICLTIAAFIVKVILMNMAQAKPSFLHKVFYILAILIGADVGFILGKKFDGVFLGILLAIVGAIALSTLVGYIAVNVFNYKPSSIPKAKLNKFSNIASKIKRYFWQKLSYIIAMTMFGKGGYLLGLIYAKNVLIAVLLAMIGTMIGALLVNFIGVKLFNRKKEEMFLSFTENSKTKKLVDDKKVVFEKLSFILMIVLLIVISILSNQNLFRLKNIDLSDLMTKNTTTIKNIPQEDYFEDIALGFNRDDVITKLGFPYSLTFTESGRLLFYKESEEYLMQENNKNNNVIDEWLYLRGNHNLIINDRMYMSNVLDKILGESKVISITCVEYASGYYNIYQNILNPACVIYGKDSFDGVGIASDEKNVYKFLGEPTYTDTTKGHTVENKVLIYKDRKLIIETRKVNSSYSKVVAITKINIK